MMDFHHAGALWLVREPERAMCEAKQLCELIILKEISIKYGGDGGSEVSMLASVTKAASRSTKHEVSQAAHQVGDRIVFIAMHEFILV